MLAWVCLYRLLTSFLVQFKLVVLTIKALRDLVPTLNVYFLLLFLCSSIVLPSQIYFWSSL